MFEARVPRETIVAFRSCAFNNAQEQESSFYRLWKGYLARSGRSEEGAAAEQERVDQLHGLMGDNNATMGCWQGARLPSRLQGARLPRSRLQRRNPMPLAMNEPEGRVDGIKTRATLPAGSECM